MLSSGERGCRGLRVWKTAFQRKGKRASLAVVGSANKSKPEGVLPNGKTGDGYCGAVGGGFPAAFFQRDGDQPGSPRRADGAAERPHGTAEYAHAAAGHASGPARPLAAERADGTAERPDGAARCTYGATGRAHGESVAARQ